MHAVNIFNITVKDEAVYRCVATNAAGSVSTDCEVLVEGTRKLFLLFCWTTTNYEIVRNNRMVVYRYLCRESQSSSNSHEPRVSVCLLLLLLLLLFLLFWCIPFTYWCCLNNTFVKICLIKYWKLFSSAVSVCGKSSLYTAQWHDSCELSWNFEQCVPICYLLLRWWKRR